MNDKTKEAIKKYMLEIVLSCVLALIGLIFGILSITRKDGWGVFIAIVTIIIPLLWCWLFTKMGKKEIEKEAQELAKKTKTNIENKKNDSDIPNNTPSLENTLPISNKTDDDTICTKNNIEQVSKTEKDTHTNQEIDQTECTQNNFIYHTDSAEEQDTNATTQIFVDKAPSEKLFEELTDEDIQEILQD